MALGSRMSVLSRRAGVRVTMARYSPGKFPLGMGTEAVRQMWSDVSLRKPGTLAPRDGGAKPEAVAEAPWDWRIVDSRERPAVRPGRPRAFFAMMISSKRRREGSFAGFISRSWMNSLKPVVSTGQSPYRAKMDMGESLPCVSRSIVAYSC
jgi:hypothetical protein